MRSACASRSDKARRARTGGISANRRAASTDSCRVASKAQDHVLSQRQLLARAWRSERSGDKIREPKQFAAHLMPDHGMMWSSSCFEGATTWPRCKFREAAAPGGVLLLLESAPVFVCVSERERSIVGGRSLLPPTIDLTRAHEELRRARGCARCCGEPPHPLSVRRTSGSPRNVRGARCAWRGARVDGERATKRRNHVGRSVARAAVRALQHKQTKRDTFRLTDLITFNATDDGRLLVGDESRRIEGRRSTP
jgi:hypothetical protein